MEPAKPKAKTPHERRLAAAKRMMGSRLATHSQSTFQAYAGQGSRLLEAFRARREAERLGLIPADGAPAAALPPAQPAPGQVTQLASRRARRSA
jgi:hypothetical protein